MKNKFYEKAVLKTSLIIASFFALPFHANAMHIMEGFLPPAWSISWGVISIPFLVTGFYSIKKKIAGDSRKLLLLAMCGAFVFVLSALKLPSVTGSCSHPTGIGLGTIIFGPSAMSLISLIVLLFQAILLAHGGLTTLGANTFSMGIAGPLAAYGAYFVLKKFKVRNDVCVFFAAFLGALFTYVVTSFQLAVAFPDPVGGLLVSFAKFLSVFAVTQLPLAVSEGILTVIVYEGVVKYSSSELEALNTL